MGETQSWVKVEHWYHLLVALGATGVVASLTVDVKGIANAHALLLSLGAMFIGLGEWINHPLQTKLMRPTIYAPNGGVISGHPRNPSNLGNLFDVLGFVLLVAALFKIARRRRSIEISRLSALMANPSLKRDAPRAARPLAPRWALNFRSLEITLCL